MDNEGRAVDVVCLDSSRDFDTVSQNILLGIESSMKNRVSHEEEEKSDSQVRVKHILCPVLELNLVVKVKAFGFSWQGFGRKGGAIGMASIRSCQKLPQCPAEPTPASSKTDPQLAKGKPITNSGGISGTTYIRRRRGVYKSLAKIGHKVIDILAELDVWK
ncbi:hypothetical protein TURU_156874 [Turdus rufiventris]|nr:hypothetical protein TURU_156874 [Turdus rufiventris]